MNAQGLSQSELARRVGVSQQTIGKLSQGTTAGSKHLHRIARELGTTPAYLTGETDDPSAGALPMPTPEIVAAQLDLVPVVELTLAFGMGAAFIDDHQLDQVVRWFPRALLEAFTSAPHQMLTFMRGRGDSMVPTILDGDLVLVDRTQNQITEQDRIWACAWGEFGALKRLRSIPGGQIKIMSDNPNVSDEIVTRDEINIIGRVCGNLRRM